MTPRPGVPLPLLAWVALALLVWAVVLVAWWVR